MCIKYSAWNTIDGKYFAYTPTLKLCVECMLFHLDFPFAFLYRSLYGSIYCILF